MPPAESLSFWRKGMSDAERARAMVKCHKLIAGLPYETYRRDRDIDNVRLYEADPNATLSEFAGRYFADSGGAMPFTPPDDSTNNRAKAMIDTLLSQVASTNQRARFLVNDGSYRQQRRGREMQKFSDGLVYELKLHRLRKRMARDAAVLQSGVGVLQFYRDGDRVACQRILAPELSWNPRDGLIDGMPRTIYRRRPVPRDKVIADFAAVDEALTKLIESQQVQAGIGQAADDDVDVFEAWHLPTGEGTDDGWHIIALDIDGGDLLIEPYTKLHHELVFFAWEERFATGWGLSPMTCSRKLQRRINANSYRIDRAQKLFSAGHLYVPREMKLDKGQLSNEIGSSWVGNGPNPPKQVLFQAATKEMYDAVERDGQRIFENYGVNQDEAEGDSGSGLDASGAALRERSKKSTKRQSMRQQRWEDNHLDCVRVALSIVRDIVTKNAAGEKRSKSGGYKVAVPGKRGLSVVDWHDVAADEKDYVLETKVASPVPTDPEGLMAYGEQMVNLGAWTPSEFKGYMQDLDSDGRVNKEMAPQRRLEEMFEELLYEPKAAAMPDEWTNYQLALEIGVDYLEQGKEDGVPEKHLERVRRYLKRCKALDLKVKAAAAPPAPPAAPVAAPIAA